MAKKIARCPGCGAPDKDPDRPKTYLDQFGNLRNRMTTYVCGTVTSPDWAPPIYDKNCHGTHTADPQEVAP